MSATLLHEARPKARKSHRCSLCTGLIKPGETYQRDTLVFDGRVYDWLTCPRCETDEISDRVAVWSYANQDEGYDAYTAHEWATETARYPGHPDDMATARRFLNRANPTERPTRD